MKTIITLLCGMVLTGGVSPAREKVERRMTELLDPLARQDYRVFATSPKPRANPAWVEHTEAKMPRAEVLPPTVPGPAAKPIRPRLPGEPGAFSNLIASSAEGPKAPKLPAGELWRQWSPDAKTPPPLPILGKYAADRTSLADPTLETSVETTRTPQSPARAGAVPFAPLNLPDPFENATTIRLRQPWAENAEPPLFVIAPTRR
jgi:hypothetical protein